MQTQSRRRTLSLGFQSVWRDNIKTRALDPDFAFPTMPKWTHRKKRSTPGASPAAPSPAGSSRSRSSATMRSPAQEQPGSTERAAKRHAPESAWAAATTPKSGSGCRCKHSRCIKKSAPAPQHVVPHAVDRNSNPPSRRYCDCFAAGEYCKPECACHNCVNTPAEQHAAERAQAIAVATSRPRRSFGGCRCKKSSCLKKYCECFNSEVPCTEACKCVNCANVFGVRSGTPPFPRDGGPALASAGGSAGSPSSQPIQPTMPSAAGYQAPTPVVEIPAEIVAAATLDSIIQQVLADNKQMIGAPIFHHIPGVTMRCPTCRTGLGNCCRPSWPDHLGGPGVELVRAAENTGTWSEGELARLQSGMERYNVGSALDWKSVAAMVGTRGADACSSKAFRLRQAAERGRTPGSARAARAPAPSAPGAARLAGRQPSGGAPAESSSSPRFWKASRYVCKHCGGHNDGSFGNGRFCSQLCRNNHRARNAAPSSSPAAPKESGAQLQASTAVARQEKAKPVRTQDSKDSKDSKDSTTVEETRRKRAWVAEMMTVANSDVAHRTKASKFARIYERMLAEWGRQNAEGDEEEGSVALPSPAAAAPPPRQEPPVCEECGEQHSGQYGSGRFCSEGCRFAFGSRAAARARRGESNPEASPSQPRRNPDEELSTVELLRLTRSGELTRQRLACWWASDRSFHVGTVARCDTGKLFGLGAAFEILYDEGGWEVEVVNWECRVRLLGALGPRLVRPPATQRVLPDKPSAERAAEHKSAVSSTNMLQPAEKDAEDAEIRVGDDFQAVLPELAVAEPSLSGEDMRRAGATVWSPASASAQAEAVGKYQKDAASGLETLSKAHSTSLRIRPYWLRTPVETVLEHLHANDYDIDAAAAKLAQLELAREREARMLGPDALRTFEEAIDEYGINFGKIAAEINVRLDATATPVDVPFLVCLFYSKFKHTASYRSWKRSKRRRLDERADAPEMMLTRSNSIAGSDSDSMFDWEPPHRNSGGRLLCSSAHPWPKGYVHVPGVRPQQFTGGSQKKRKRRDEQQQQSPAEAAEPLSVIPSRWSVELPSVVAALAESRAQEPETEAACTVGDRVRMLLTEGKESYWYSGEISAASTRSSASRPLVDILFDDGLSELEVELVVDGRPNPELRLEREADPVRDVVSYLVDACRGEDVRYEVLGKGSADPTPAPAAAAPDRRSLQIDDEPPDPNSKWGFADGMPAVVTHQAIDTEVFTCFKAFLVASTQLAASTVRSYEAAVRHVLEGKAIGFTAAPGLDLGQPAQIEQLLSDLKKATHTRRELNLTHAAFVRFASFMSKAAQLEANPLYIGRRQEAAAEKPASTAASTAVAVRRTSSGSALECEICGAVFKRPCELGNHLKGKCGNHLKRKAESVSPVEAAPPAKARKGRGKAANKVRSVTAGEAQPLSAGERKAPRGWTAEDDQKLLSAIAEHGWHETKWPIISTLVGAHRTDRSCKSRWQRMRAAPPEGAEAMMAQIMGDFPGGGTAAGRGSLGGRGAFGGRGAAAHDSTRAGVVSPLVSEHQPAVQAAVAVRTVPGAPPTAPAAPPAAPAPAPAPGRPAQTGDLFRTIDVVCTPSGFGIVIDDTGRVDSTTAAGVEVVRDHLGLRHSPREIPAWAFLTLGVRRGASWWAWQACACPGGTRLCSGCRRSRPWAGRSRSCSTLALEPGEEGIF